MSANLSPNSSLVSIASILRGYLYIYKRGRREGEERGREVGKSGRGRSRKRGIERR